MLIDITRPVRPGMTLYPGDPPVRLEAVTSVTRDGYAVSRLALGTHTGTHLDPPAHFIGGGLTVDQAPLDLLVGPARVVAVRAGPEITRAAVEAIDLTGVERVLFRTAGGAGAGCPVRRCRVLRTGGRGLGARYGALHLSVRSKRPARTRHACSPRCRSSALRGTRHLPTRHACSPRWRSSARSGTRRLPHQAWLAADAARLLAEQGVRLVGIDSLSVDPLEFPTPSAHRELLGRGVWILENLDLSAVSPGDYELICLPLKIAGGDGAPARVLLRAADEGVREGQFQA